jgi:hypothetical protein
VRPRVRAARRRLEVVVVIAAVVPVVGQRQPAAPHADDDREHDRDVGAAMPVRKSAGMHHSDGIASDWTIATAPGAKARRGGEREVLEPLAVLELAEREALVLVLAALAGLQRRARAPARRPGSATARRRAAVSTTLRCTPSVTSPASSTAKIAHSTTCRGV